MPATLEDTTAVRDAIADLGWDIDILPMRYYPAATLHGDTLDAGYWVDHGDAEVQRLVYELRNMQGGNRLSHEPIAAVIGLRHWRDSYNAARNIGRRRDGDQGRNAAGDLTWRRWNRPRNMVRNAAAPARDGARPDGSLVVRRFGIEVEFNMGSGGYSQRGDIVADLTAAGIAAEVESYNHQTRPHWKMTTDATVTGGELVSPILAGDTASLDEVRDVLRIVKARGAESTQTVGMHVHHDATDFTTEADRHRLVDTLMAAESAMSMFVLPARINGLTSCGAQTMSASEWRTCRADVGRIVPGANPSSYSDYGSVTRYRFFNVCGPLNKYGTVEMRGLGATLHAGKVRCWVRTGQAIMQAAREGIEIPFGCTPEVLTATLVDNGLLGPQTASKFVAECRRRHPVAAF